VMMGRPLSRQDVDEGKAAVQLGVAVAATLREHPSAFVRHTRAGYMLSHNNDVVDLMALPEEVALRVLVLLGKTDDELRSHLVRRGEIDVASPAGTSDNGGGRG
jgi:hypothetical protein